jgi:hypothetical protein
MYPSAAPVLASVAVQLRAKHEFDAVQGKQTVARIGQLRANLFGPRRMREVAGRQKVDALQLGPCRQVLEADSRLVDIA